MDLITFSLALSLHLGFEDKYNSVHPHIRYHNESTIAGIYYNSEREISTYIGQRFEHQDLGFELAAVTGYSYATITPYVRATYKDFFVSPGYENGGFKGAVLGIELKF